MRPLFLTVGLLFAGLAQASPPGGDASSSTLQRTADRAVAQFHRGDYAGALAVFREMAKQAPSPKLAARIRFNIARCLEELGRRREAIAAFETYLERPGDAETRTRASNRVRALKARLFGRLLVACEPSSGALVSLTSMPDRWQPCPARFDALEPGVAELRVRFSEGELVQRKATIAAGALAQIDVEQPEVSSTKIPWILMGTGTTLLLTGLGFYAANQRTLEDLRDDPGNADLRRRVDRDRVLSLVGYDLGAAVLVAAGAWAALGNTAWSW